MRFADRAAVVAPPSLQLAKRSGKTETEEAIEFFLTYIIGGAPLPFKKGTKKRIAKTFPFSAYKGADVKVAIESLFYGKCAYCEARYEGVHPVDVEHWRPKSEVIDDDAGKKKRFGYYWLAASWPNLLPSCIDCNRARRHYDYVEKKQHTIGKGNWFPLKNGCVRAVDAKSIKAEKPLLLHPCVDEPHNFLEFDEKGVVRERPGRHTAAKGAASIRFYALNRSGLVKVRREKILLIKQKMKTIEDFAYYLEQARADGRSTVELEGSLRRELRELKDHQRPESEFSLMASQMIEKFLKSDLGRSHT